MPVSTSRLELYIYPRWGELKLRYVKNLLEYSHKCGRAARMISPPRLWPIKLSRLRHEAGQNDKMYCFTSLARRSPISMISPSVCSSLLVESKITASGC